MGKFFDEQQRIANGSFRFNADLVKILPVFDDKYSISKWADKTSTNKLTQQINQELLKILLLPSFVIYDLLNIYSDANDMSTTDACDIYLEMIDRIEHLKTIVLESNSFKKYLTSLEAASDVNLYISNMLSFKIDGTNKLIKTNKVRGTEDWIRCTFEELVDEVAHPKSNLIIS